MAILILLMGALEILRTPTDIFPNINIPVVSIIWNYTGLIPQDMADRIVVLEGGRLVEEGTHPQLMALGGRYASMFEMQAASYR